MSRSCDGAAARLSLVARLALIGMAIVAVSEGSDRMSDFRLHSSAFVEGGSIPIRFTCDGEGISPPLSWTGVPAEARSLALIVEDPDAPDPRHPRLTWVHWLLYDLPPGATGLPAAMRREALPPGTRLGRNDWKRGEFGAPCPPIGRHRYLHHLYALDVRLPDLHQPSRAQLLEALHDHILAESVLVGTYERSRK